MIPTSDIRTDFVDGTLLHYDETRLLGAQRISKFQHHIGVAAGDVEKSHIGLIHHAPDFVHNVRVLKAIVGVTEFYAGTLKTLSQCVSVRLPESVRVSYKHRPNAHALVILPCKSGLVKKGIRWRRDHRSTIRAEASNL
ncbi:MAG: hypothetical protein ACXWNK_05265 [Vulcanimicrobiaceae bacterium]